MGRRRSASTSGGVGFSYAVHGFVGFALYALRRAIDNARRHQRGQRQPQNLPIDVRGGSFVVSNTSCFVHGSYTGGLAEDSGLTPQALSRQRAPSSPARFLPVGVSLPASTDACGVAQHGRHEAIAKATESLLRARWSAEHRQGCRFLPSGQ